jgi:hypothetical protein
MRAILALAISLTLLASGAVCAPARPSAISDPKTFVQETYRRLATDNDYAPPQGIYTPRLQQLFDLEAREAGGEVGRIDFDFWTNAQDWELHDIKVSSEPVEGAPGRRIVTARFRNLDRNEVILFYFQKIGTRWLLDDVRSDGGTERWVLSIILKYGWSGPD